MRLFIFILLSLIALSSGCSGNGNSTTSTLPSGSVCYQQNQAVQFIEDILVNVFSADENGDKCLTPTERSELDKAVAMAKPNTFSSAGVNTGTDMMVIEKLIVRGNAEVSDKKAQLHTNMSNGLFSLSIQIDNSLGLTDNEIRVIFSNKQPSEITEKNLQTTIKFSNLPKGKVIVASYCNYRMNLSFACGPYYYFVDNNPFSSHLKILNSDNGQHFDKSTTIPQPGYVIATICKDDQCLDNYAEVATQFN